MKTKRIWANLSVANVNKTYEFYEQLGFQPNGKFIRENELASFKVADDEFVNYFFSNANSMFKASLGGEIADLKCA